MFLKSTFVIILSVAAIVSRAEDLSNATSDLSAVIEEGVFLECSKLPGPHPLKHNEALFNLVISLGLLEKSEITGKYAYISDANLNVACWVVVEIVTDSTGGDIKTFAKARYAIDDRFRDSSILKGFACMPAGPVFKRDTTIQVIKDIKLSDKPNNFCDEEHRKEAFHDIFEIEKTVTRFIPLRVSKRTGELVVNLGF